MPLTRRNFLRSSAALAASTAAARHSSAANSPTRPIRYTPLAYNEVELLSGPMLDQFQHNHGLFLALDDDRLLKPFRQLAGRPAPGEDMGGWYSPSPDFDPPRNMTGYIPGHSFGQYMSGLARAYAVTGDPATKQKVDGLVTGFGGTISTKFYEHYPLPCYTFEKTLQGLSDAHQFCHTPNALATLNAALDAALPWLPDHALTRAEMNSRPHPNAAYAWDESYTLPENLYIAYTRGAGTRFHTLAQRYLQNSTYFTPLSNNKNVLPGQHAYSHVNALNSALQSYLVDRSTMHLQAAQNGFRFVQQQSYATGGWGPDETFQKPGTNELADKVEHGHGSFETPCGACGHFKIARGLLSVTGHPSYGDSMETVLLNTILGALPIQPDGTSFYYANYSPNSTRQYYEQKWPCCSGTFPQLTADYGISTYLRTPKGLAVNLYHPSRARTRIAGAIVMLTQHTQYPNSGEIAIQVATDREVRFPLQLRIPTWAGPASRLQINGRSGATPSLTPGTWCTLDRTWRSGDHVELTLDMPLRLMPLDASHPNLVALVAGPLALFALEPASQQVTAAQMLSATRLPGDSPAWQIATAFAPLHMLPYTAVGQQSYRLYLKTTA